MIQVVARRGIVDGVGLLAAFFTGATLHAVVDFGILQGHSDHMDVQIVRFAYGKVAFKPGIYLGAYLGTSITLAPT